MTFCIVGKYGNCVPEGMKNGRYMKASDKIRDIINKMQLSEYNTDLGNSGKGYSG